MNKSINLLLFLSSILILTSCGPTKEEIAAREKEKKDSTENANINFIKSKVGIGAVMRGSDSKELSDIKLKFSHDTMFVFSNALFGSENDTLIIKKLSLSDSSLVLYSPRTKTENTFVFLHEFENSIRLINSDFHVSINLYPKSAIQFNKEDLAFYKNIPVPTNPNYYLDGTYKGQLEMEDQLSNMFLQLSMKGVQVKLTFLENFKVKQTGGGIVGTSSQTNDYYIIDDKLFIKEGKKEDLFYKIKDNGEKLVFQNDKLSIILNKVD